MPNISRHPVDLEDARDALKYRAEELAYEVEHARVDLLGCNRICNHSVAYAGYVALLEPSSPELCRALRTGAQAMAAVFAGAMAGGAEIDVRLGHDQPFRVSSRVSEGSHDAGNWLRGFFLAVIGRERDLIDSLCSVPLDVMRRSTTQVDEFQYLYVKALQAYSKREEDAPQTLLAALEAAHPDRLEIADADYVLSVPIPQMEVLYQLMLQDAAGFNKSLAKALGEHKRYWGQKTGKRNLDAGAFIAIGLTALASFAHEAGIAIEVESDYLPARLVRGECHPD